MKIGYDNTLNKQSTSPLYSKERKIKKSARKAAKARKKFAKADAEPTKWEKDGIKKTKKAERLNKSAHRKQDKARAIGKTMSEEDKTKAVKLFRERMNKNN
tara:strand:- start:298 stop:600 length:303 start_codon:yes stop_codon:yes gene_type:complete